MSKLSLDKKLYSKRMIKKATKKIELLGDNCNFTVSEFLAVRTFGSIIVFIILLFNKYGYILAPVCSITFYYFVNYIFLDLPIKKRGLKLEHEAIFFFEILELTLESGSTLSQALELTSSNVDSELSKEFAKTLDEVKLGKSLIEGLKDMKYRIPSETINNTILNLTESSIFGSNIINSLNNQLDYLHNKEIFEIKARINKLPTKISVISVIFFIPILLLVILAPVIINYFK